MPCNGGDCEQPGNGQKVLSLNRGRKCASWSIAWKRQTNRVQFFARTVKRLLCILPICGRSALKRIMLYRRLNVRSPFARSVLLDLIGNRTSSNKKSDDCANA